jgi:hypothetical protein
MFYAHELASIVELVEGLLKSKRFGVYNYKRLDELYPEIKAAALAAKNVENDQEEYGFYASKPQWECFEAEEALKLLRVGFKG